MNVPTVIVDILGKIARACVQHSEVPFAITKGHAARASMARDFVIVQLVGLATHANIVLPHAIIMELH